MVKGEFPLDMLVITKTLKGTYKNPDQIAHKVLAERIGKRDPGNKPMVNDRIPFVYIETKEKKGQTILQGDRIENPDYIENNKLTPDYKFYITNQIMKPVCQIYSLILEDLEGFRKENNFYEKKYTFLLRTKTEEKANQKIIDMKMEDTCDIIFGDIIRDIENKRKKITKITHFFKKK
jgi:DNA polymerase elongation subunit (family B)